MSARVGYFGGVARDGLVFHFDAAKKDSYPGSGTVWRDLSGSGNFGTLVGSPLFSVEGGGCIVLNGTTQYIPTNVTTNYSVYTVSAWVKPGVGSFADGQYIINKNSYWASTTNSWPTAMGLNQNGTTGYFFVVNGTTYQINTSGVQCTGTTSVGSWNYLVGTYDLSSAKLYINGVLIQSLNFSSTPPSTGFAWTIGRGAQMFSGGASSQPFFKGSISQVSLYSRAITATEVLQNYNSLKGRYNLV